MGAWPGALLDEGRVRDRGECGRKSFFSFEAGDGCLGASAVLRDCGAFVCFGGVGGLEAAVVHGIGQALCLSVDT